MNSTFLLFTLLSTALFHRPLSRLTDDQRLRAVECLKKIPKKSNPPLIVGESIEGPYYVSQQRFREKINEDQQGIPLLFEIEFLDINGCKPLEDAYVEVWHCNASGEYSGFTGFDPDTNLQVSPCLHASHEKFLLKDGGTCMTDTLSFLRGVQKTDSKGKVRFETIFPGYYLDRTNHIHFIVKKGGKLNPQNRHEGGQAIHIGQIYLPDEITEKVYKNPLYRHKNDLSAPLLPVSEDLIFGLTNGGPILKLEPLRATGLLPKASVSSKLENTGASPVTGGYMGKVSIFVDSLVNSEIYSGYKYDGTNPTGLVWTVDSIKERFGDDFAENAEKIPNFKTEQSKGSADNNKASNIGVYSRAFHQFPGSLSYSDAKHRKLSDEPTKPRDSVVSEPKKLKRGGIHLEGNIFVPRYGTPAFTDTLHYTEPAHLVRDDDLSVEKTPFSKIEENFSENHRSGEEKSFQTRDRLLDFDSPSAFDKHFVSPFISTQLLLDRNYPLQESKMKLDDFLETEKIINRQLEVLIQEENALKSPLGSKSYHQHDKNVDSEKLQPPEFSYMSGDDSIDDRESSSSECSSESGPFILSKKTEVPETKLIVQKNRTAIKLLKHLHDKVASLAANVVNSAEEFGRTLLGTTTLKPNQFVRSNVNENSKPFYYVLVPRFLTSWLSREKKDVTTASKEIREKVFDIADEISDYVFGTERAKFGKDKNKEKKMKQAFFNYRQESGAKRTPPVDAHLGHGIMRYVI